MHEITISKMKAAIETIVIMLNGASAYLLVNSSLKSSPNKAYTVRIVMVVEKNLLSSSLSMRHLVLSQQVIGGLEKLISGGISLANAVLLDTDGIFVIASPLCGVFTVSDES